MRLTDPAVTVYVESVNFFEFFHELSHRVLRQLKLVFETFENCDEALASFNQV